MRRVIWSDPAREDVFALLEHYDSIDRALALSMARQMQAAPTALLDRPLMGSLVGRGAIRKWPIARTPLLLLYLPDGEEVEIRRVHHEREDWRSGP